jgi:hypothetical protein
MYVIRSVVVYFVLRVYSVNVVYFSIFSECDAVYCNLSHIPLTVILSNVADYIDCNSNKYSVGVAAFVKVELKNGIQHQDVGYGICKDSCNKGYAIAHARKVSGLLQHIGIRQKQKLLNLRIKLIFELHIVY